MLTLRKIFQRLPRKWFYVFTFNSAVCKNYSELLPDKLYSRNNNKIVISSGHLSSLKFNSKSTETRLLLEIFLTELRF